MIHKESKFPSANMMAKDLTEKGIVLKKLPEGLKQFVTEEKEQDNKVR